MRLLSFGFLFPVCGFIVGDLVLVCDGLLFLLMDCVAVGVVEFAFCVCVMSLSSLLVVGVWVNISVVAGFFAWFGFFFSLSFPPSPFCFLLTKGFNFLYLAGATCFSGGSRFSFLEGV